MVEDGGSVALGGLLGLLSGVPLIWVAWRVPQRLLSEWGDCKLVGWSDPAIQSFGWQDLLFVGTLGLAGAAVTASWGWTASGLIALCFCAVLLLLARIDARSGLLPDTLTLPLLWMGLLGHAVGLADLELFGELTLEQAVWGAAAGYIVLWLPCLLLRCWLGREMMGHGDFKLSAALGAWLGCAALPYVWLIASCTSLLLALIAYWFGKRALKESMPFGPALALGGMLMLFFNASG